jgi:hypothetical protein
MTAPSETEGGQRGNDQNVRIRSGAQQGYEVGSQEVDAHGVDLIASVKINPKDLC